MPAWQNLSMRTVRLDKGFRHRLLAAAEELAELDPRHLAEALAHLEAAAAKLRSARR
jgi:hypothetical protein